MHTYTDALLVEMTSAAERAKGMQVESVFFGGGTPSLLPLADTARLLDAVGHLFSLSSCAEITLEANPASASGEKLSSLAKLGFNRLSIGMQSGIDRELKALGRVHDAKAAALFVEQARTAGFSNINLDLMYGIPGQTVASFAETLDKALSLSPEQLSVYSLIVEPGTPFYEQRDRLALPDEDEELLMYQMLLRQLREQGFSRYEISNFAKDGFVCHHNMRYWHSEEYLGFGLGAASFFDGVRYMNGTDLAAYLEDPTSQIVERQVLSPADEAYEYIMLRLRLSEGICLAEYRALFGEDLEATHQKDIARFMTLGWMKIKDGRMYLTDEGMEVSNSILLAFLP